MVIDWQRGKAEVEGWLRTMRGWGQRSVSAEKRREWMLLLGVLVSFCGAVGERFWIDEWQWFGIEARAQAQEIPACEARLQVSPEWLGGERPWLSWADHAPCGELLRIAQLPESDFARELKTLVQGYPIEEMVPFIAEQERNVAAFLVGIAKKESQWGKHSPSLGGITCYNYWGYKGRGSRGSSQGYSCFGSAQEAVDTVGGRLYDLVHLKKRDTPSEMVVWKCGSSCAWDKPENVKKWIGDVSVYYYKIAKKENAG